jgi:AAA+ superfamily predicted ATPase
MKQDLDAHIAKINKDKLDLQRQFDDMKVKLSEERDALLSELDKRKEAHEMIVNETINKIDVNKKEIE